MLTDCRSHSADVAGAYDPQDSLDAYNGKRSGTQHPAVCEQVEGVRDVLQINLETKKWVCKSFQECLSRVSVWFVSRVYLEACEAIPSVKGHPEGLIFTLRFEAGQRMRNSTERWQGCCLQTTLVLTIMCPLKLGRDRCGCSLFQRSWRPLETFVSVLFAHTHIYMYMYIHMRIQHTDIHETHYIEIL